MTRSRGPLGWAAVALVAGTALIVTACGDTDAPHASSAASSGQTSASPADAAARENGDWLLRFTTAGGEDGEQEGSVYVRYDPATGTATTRSLPALRAADATEDQQVLLVNADHTRAIQDTAVPKDQSSTGKLVLYSLTGDTTETLDIRAATGEPALRAVAWAFDPSNPDLLRVVDSGLGVWKVDVGAGSATKDGQLEKRSGWIFGNGFDKNTGEPYIESIDSDETEPAGNGDSDTRPVERQDGTLVRYDGESLDGLPAPPCGLAGVFRFDDGDAWVFCADTSSISAYRLSDGDQPAWVAAGKASPEVVPASAADLGFVLPPVD